MNGKILVIAPNSDLTFQQDEVDGLLNTLSNAISITGDVTERRLVGYFEEKLEGIWFAGHSALEGVLLGNEVLNADALVSYVNRAQVEWLVLNSCQSDSLINKLLLATSADILVVSGDVLDNDAWRVARFIAMELANGLDLRDAVAKVLPGQLGKHRFYQNVKRQFGMNYTERSANNDNRELYRRLDELNKSLAELATSLSKVNQDIAVLNTKIDNIEEKFESQRIIFSVLLFASIIVSAMVSQIIYHFSVGM